MENDRIIGNKSHMDIPPKVHAEYIGLHKKIDATGGDVADEDFGKVLFSRASDKKKKEALLVLAHRPTAEAYGFLKRYAKKPDRGLATWAALALGECKMFVESELREEDVTSIITGAGGDGNRQRCYFVLHTLSGKLLTLQQQNVIKLFFAEVAEKLAAAVERITLKGDHVTLQTLIPFDIAPADFVEDGIKRCNGKSRFLCNSYFISNVSKPSASDIRKFIRSCLGKTSSR